ncbi:flavin reductase family protein [Lentzea sp.]|uniref:flavin reductase family protein n=1 Tax=Lentzea sp. TaxID=56099 RepID=UPI002C8C6433|nr:flavin reductase family protein [Lentzea sp.]HUQ57185.1 flavin reductase family protein [Lentzea sp.]
MSSTQLHDERQADALRRAARRFATGVTVVAVRDGGGEHALTANSFVTLSLHPALVGVSVTTDGRMRYLAERARYFGISVLDAEQEEYARHYARRGRDGAPDHLGLRTLDTVPAPVVPGCVAYFVCEFAHTHPVGDHDLIVGSVVESRVVSEDRAPLIFLDGKFG